MNIKIKKLELILVKRIKRNGYSTEEAKNIAEEFIENEILNKKCFGVEIFAIMKKPKDSEVIE